MRSKKAWTLWELRNFTTDDPFTRNLRHIQPFPKRIITRANLAARRGGESRLKAVPAKDRIKWWNVVPGDQVRLMSDKTSRIREVMSVNKIRNRIFLKSDQKVSKKKLYLSTFIIFSTSGRHTAAKTTRYQCRLLKSTIILGPLQLSISQRTR